MGQKRIRLTDASINIQSGPYFVQFDGKGVVGNVHCLPINEFIVIFSLACKLFSEIDSVFCLRYSAIMKDLFFCQW